ncbi:WXG100 family type VII secretion target [Nocardia transvalensis]|uniref:WXG100 family type VII secretion target n=1 Tax=Nocardia transvalensis TaxID=37333 RepID=A0A7W9PBA0_9NOCA|nr:WXG100 family type VII secretion target [Nocardia transvalensis]MBB5912845.1 WXG100 family type VII secretion target [Nocardia transvalensis]
MVHVDPALAKKAEQAMAAAVDNMRSALHKIDTDVTNAAGWRGEARDAFGAAAEHWGKQSDKIHALLNRITEQVGHGSKQFEAMETDNHAEFQHLMGL